MIKTKLFTRQEIIDEWEKEKDKLNSYICPFCNSILHHTNGVYYCNNVECFAYREGFEIEKE